MEDFIFYFVLILIFLIPIGIILCIFEYLLRTPAELLLSKHGNSSSIIKDIHGDIFISDVCIYESGIFNLEKLCLRKAKQNSKKNFFIIVTKEIDKYKQNWNFLDGIYLKLDNKKPKYFEGDNDRHKDKKKYVEKLTISINKTIIKEMKNSTEIQIQYSSKKYRFDPIHITGIKSIKKFYEHVVQFKW